MLSKNIQIYIYIRVCVCVCIYTHREKTNDKASGVNVNSRWIWERVSFVLFLNLQMFINLKLFPNGSFKKDSLWISAIDETVSELHSPAFLLCSSLLFCFYIVNKIYVLFWNSDSRICFRFSITIEHFQYSLQSFCCFPRHLLVHVTFK